jgi:hypothetical protein
MVFLGFDVPSLYSNTPDFQSPSVTDNHGITLDHTQEERGCDFVRASDYVYVLEWLTRHVSISGIRSMFPPNH